MNPRNKYGESENQNKQDFVNTNFLLIFENDKVIVTYLKVNTKQEHFNVCEAIEILMITLRKDLF